MRTSRYDVVLLSDFRFPGGTSSAMAEEIKAGAAAGYRIGLVHVEAPNLTYPFPINPRIRPLIDAGLAEICDDAQPLEAGIALIHNPHVLRHLPFRCPRVRSEIRLLVVHHPPMSADGQPYYDVNAVRVHADDVLGGEVLWAPVGPLVRAQLAALEGGPVLLPWDWYDVVDVAAWRLPRQRFADPRPVIGRHTRPDRRKWPDTREQILAAYPDDPRLLVRILGGGSFLAEVVGLYPRNWQVRRFDEVSPQAFLGGIDFFVYFHHSSWVEAFGCAIAEAMASGAVAILPAHFRELFREAAIYAEPGEVAGHALRLRADHAAYRRQGQCGQTLVEERFSHEAHRHRLAELIGPPPPTRAAVPEPRGPLRAGHRRERPRRILLLSSNGIGMGHLTRLLALARRCSAPLTPVFATMSQAVSVLSDAGYLAHYLPYHDYLGCDVNTWNKHLRQELNELIALYEASVVVGDFNSPFQGVLDAIQDNPQTWFIWCRRPMWKPGAGAKFIERERYFPIVLEPQELAGAFDAGLTNESRTRTRTVPPVRLLDNHELLPRAVARRELGLDLKGPAVIMMLGSGNNYDYASLSPLIVDYLGRRGVQIVAAQWLMADHGLPLPQGVVRMRRFPLARWFNAFDAAISAVGYNSFHELIFAGVPTVFVPNENPQQDDQLARARYADRHGLSFCLRTQDVYQVKPTLERLLDSQEQAAIRARCATLDQRNGAVDGARMIEEFVYIHRVDRSRTI